MVSMFQSLLGFLMRCDDGIELWEGSAVAVSIPAGFSDALRHHGFCKFGTPCSMFQSLLGFLMRCDRRAALVIDVPDRGFNPCWVF